jgi:hypothetical protein
MKKLITIFVLFAAGLLRAQIVAPQIVLSGNIGCGGIPCLNNGTLVMTDASRNMTALEASALGGFKVTGTWTASRTLTMPSGRFQFVAVENATTGGFSLILCGVSGTCLTIPSGQTATGVWYDGTNVVGTVGGLGSPATQTVYFSAGTMITSGRALGTVYTNTGAQRLDVSVTVFGGIASCDVYALSAPHGTSVVEKAVQTYTYAGTGGHNGTVAFIPPNYDYEVTSNCTNLIDWNETTVGGTGSGSGGGGGGGIACLNGDVTAGSGGSCVTSILATVNSLSGNTCYTLSGQYVCVNPKGLTTSFGPQFSATFGCTQCGTWEVGYTISSASGTISYANPTVPTSASVSDGTNTVTLTTPFTSWTESHTYTTNTTFTLTAVGNGQTVTPTQAITFLYRTWAGGGSGVPTSATASGTSLVLNGGYGTIASVGLGNTYAGQSFTLSLSAQYPVLVLTGGCGHTFSINGLPTTFSCTAYTVTNQYGASEATGIYTGPATLTGSPIVTVNSL